MKRRKFLINSLITGGAFFIPPVFLKSDIKADPLIKLNYKPDPLTWSNNNLTLAWIGHSTVLINIFGKWILTDPALFANIGLFFLGRSIGPTRMTPPALKLDEIPRPDIILVSHAHMDHMDYPTLRDFAKKYPGQINIVVAYLNKDVIEDLPWKSISMLDWGNEIKIDEIRIRANEVKHFGWRLPWEKDRSRGFFKGGRSYNSYLVEYKGKKILFGGDTAYTDKLSVLKDENIDIAIMPVGAYNPWIKVHCNPEEALRMASSINAKYFVPIHTKTFKQSFEPFDEPIEWMKRSAPNYNIKIGLEQIGQTFVLNS